MGCGKSTVGAALAKRGFRRLDSDQIVRARVLPRVDVQAALVARFGAVVLDKRGGQAARIDRVVLAERIFGSDEDLAWVEKLLHPLVFEEWRRAWSTDPKARWAVEVPLLFEKELENLFYFTLCVACSPEEQLVRLEQRGLPRGLASQRISKQLPLPWKIERADFVLWNEGLPAFLEAQIDRLVERLDSF